MKISRRLSLFILSTLSPLGAQATSAENIRRLEGFAERQQEQKQYDKARLQGERAYFEEVEMWDVKRQRDLDQFLKDKKSQKAVETKSAEVEDQREKKKWDDQAEKDRQEYARQQALSQKEAPKHLVSEMQELGLDEERPRYDYRRRAAFGATSKYAKGGSGGSSYGGGGSSFSGSGSNYGGGSSFPPPPSFDDEGYVPAPNLGAEDFGGEVPPPPPPSMAQPFPYEGGDFIPPPPPPPMPYDEGEF